MSTTTNATPLKINVLTQEQYNNTTPNTNELYFTPKNVADYIIEQDFSGEWKWRKWNSGIAECWRVISTTASNYNSWNGGYGYQIIFQFPPDFFISSPVYTYSMYVGGGAWAICGTISGANEPNPTGNNVVYAWSNVSGSQPIKAFIQAKGRWK